MQKATHWGEIAIQNGMTIADLMHLHQLESTLIYAGQTLNVTAPKLSSSLAGQLETKSQTKPSSATDPVSSVKDPVKEKSAEIITNAANSTNYAVKSWSLEN